jgi:hypothetical protein
VQKYKAATCASTFSTAHSITVHPTTVGGTVSSATTQICLGSATGTMTLAGHTGTIVRWERRINAGAWQNIANTTTTHSETPATAGTYEYRAVLQSGTCATANSAIHTITVHPLSVGGTVTGPNTQICLGSATGTMTLAAHTGTIVRWERRFNAGVWQNIANTTTTHSETPGAAGVYEYRAVLQSGTCATANSAIHTITVHPVSVGGTVSGATTQICLGLATGTMTLAGHNGTIVRWQRSIDGGAWQNIANTATTYAETPGTAGTYQYRAEVQSGNCASTFSAAHSITVHPLTVGGSVTGTNTEICLGAATGTMTLAGHTGTILRWERRFNAGAWQNIANTTTTHSETPGAAGVYEYRAVLQSGTCATANSAIHTITVNPAAIGGTVSGANTELCLGLETGTMTLSGHTGTIVRWERRFNAGVWQNIANTTTTHSETPGAAGVYEYRAVVQSGSCGEVFSSAHSITIYAITVGGTLSGTNTEICLGDNSGIITLSGQVGSIVRWQKRLDGGAWTNIVNTNSTYSETPSGIGLWEYRAEIKSGTCNTEFSTVYGITVYPAVVAGTVSGSGTQICLGSSTGTLTLTGYVGSIVRWQRSVDGGAWVDIAHTADTYSETPGTFGTYAYRAVLQSGICGAANSAAYTITVHPLTVGGSVTGTNTEICLGAATGTMTLAGHTGTILRWERRFNAGAWQNIANTTTTHSETPGTAGVYEYRAVLQSGTCATANSAIHTITVHPVAVGGTVSGANTELCLGLETGTMTLSGHTGTIVRWERRFNAGAWQNIANTTTTHSETPVTAGVYEYRAVVQSGSCGEVFSSAHSITIYAITVGGTLSGTNTEICLGDNSGIITLSGQVGSIVRWQKRLDGGAWTNIVNTNSTYSETPSGIGLWEYRAEIKSGTCNTEFSTVYGITVYPAVVAGTVSGSGTQICLGSSTGTLTLTGYVGSIVRWQRSVDGGAWVDIAHTADTYSETPGTFGTYAYRAVLQSGICGAANSAAYTITVHPLTVGGSVTGTNTEICLGAATGTMTLAGHTGTILRWERRFNAGAWQNIANTTTTHSETPGTAGVYEYRAVLQSGTCATANSAIHTITVNPAAIGGTVSGTNTELCLGLETGTMTLSGHTGTIVRWERRFNAGAWQNIANTTTTHSETPVTAGVYEYRAVVQSGSCGEVFSSAHSITIYAVTVGGTLSGTNTEICLGDNSGIITLSGQVGSIVRWQKRLDGGAWTNIVNTNSTYSETPSGIGLWEYRAEIKSGTCNTEFSTVYGITVYPAVVAGTVSGSGTQICLGSSTGTLTLTGYVGSIVRWQRSVDGGAWVDIAHTADTYSETPGTFGTYAYRAVLQSGICGAANSAAYTITVSALTVGGSVTGSNTQICLGSSTGTLTLAGHSGNVLRWQRRFNGGAWTNIANTTTTHSEALASVGFWEFRAEVQSGSCAASFSAPFGITVSAFTVGGTLSGTSTELCFGTSTGNITLSGQTGAVVKWQKQLNGGGWTDIVHTGLTYSEIPSAAGLWEYRAQVQSGACASEFSSIHSITVYSVTVGGNVSGLNPEICLGSTTGILTLAAYNGNIIRWQKRFNGGAWTNIANTNSTYSETPASSGLWEYRAEIRNGACNTEFSSIYAITVHPGTVAGTLSTPISSICLGVSTDILSLTGFTGTIIKWQKRLDGGVWTDIIHTAATYSETPATHGLWEYRVEVQSGICAAQYSNVLAVTVAPATIAGTTSTPVTQIFIGQPTDNITLAGYTGNIVRWQKRHDLGLWTDIPHTNAIYLETPNAVGLWDYRAVVQSGSCAEQFSSFVTVEVLGSSAGGVTGGNSPICLGQNTGIMTLTGYSGSVIRWERRVDAGVWTNIANITDTYSEIPSLAGTWEYRAVVFTTVELFSAPATIVVNPLTVGGNVTGTTEICIGASTGALSLAGNIGTVLKWQKRFNAGAWIDISNTTNTYSEIPVTAGVWEYRAQVESGNCGAEFSSIHALTVSPASVAGSIGGTLTEICLGASTGTISITGYTGNILYWQRRVDGSAWSNIGHTLDTYSEIPASAGLFEYRVAVQSGICNVEFSTEYAVTVHPATVAGTLNGTQTELCLGASTGTLTLSGYTGTIVKWQKQFNAGAWTDISNTNATYSEVPATAGIWNYRAVVESGICGQSNSTEFSITVYPLTAGGSVNGVETEICLGSGTGIMTLSAHSGTIVKWQLSIDGGAWTDIANTLSTYSATPGTPGTYAYRAQVESGTCGTAFSSAHTIVVYPLTAGGNVGGILPELCLGASTGTLTLSGHSGTIVKWQRQLNGGGWSDIIHTSATYSEIPSLVGTWEYRAVLESGICGQEFSTAYSIIVYPAVVAGTVTGISPEICLTSSTGTLTLSGYTGTIEKWQKRHNGGAWTDIANTTNTYSEVPALTGTYEYRAVLQSGACGTANSGVYTIVVHPQTVAGTLNGTQTELCLGASTGTLTLSGYTGTIVKWQKQFNAGAWTDISNTNATYSEVPATAGIWNYRAVVESGICGQSNSTEFSITVYPLAAGGSVNGVETEICLGSGTGIMTLSAHSGTIVKWQLSIDGGAWTDIANTLSTYSATPGTPGTYAYRAQVESGTCGTAFSSAHTIVVYPLTAGGNVGGILPELCLGASTGTLTLSGHSGTIVKWQRQLNGGGWSDIIHTSATYSEIPSLVGTWEYRAVLESGICGQEFSTAYSIIVYPAVVAGTVTGISPEICLTLSTGTLTLSGYTGTIEKWQKRHNGGAWTDIANTTNTYSEVPALTGTYEYRAVLQSGACGTANSGVYTIVVHPQTVAGTLNGTQTELCLGASTGTLTLSGYTGTIVKWQKQFNAGAWTDISNTNATYSEVPATAGIWNYRAVVESGICGQSNSTEFSITVYPLTAGGSVNGLETEICLGSGTGIMTLSAHSGTIVKWQLSIDGGAWTDIANTLSTYSATPGTPGTYAYRAQVESGTCGTAFSSAHTIVVYPLTAGGNVGGTVNQICLGASTSTLTLTGHSGVIVKWQKRLNAGAWTDIAHTASTYSETPVLAGVWEYRAEVQSGICGTQFSGIYSITVFPTSVAGTVNGTLPEICLGSSIGTLTLSGHTGTILNWQRSFNGGVWVDVFNPSATYSEIPATPGNYSYRAVVQSGVCNVVYSASYTITVYPQTVAGLVSGGSSELCLGASTGILSLSGHTGTVVKWQKSFNGGVWTDIANTTSTYNETPSSNGTWSYRAVVESGICGQLNSTPFTITVYSVTVGGSVSGLETEICLGVSTGTLTLGGYTGTILKWQRSIDGGVWTDISHTGSTYSENPLIAGVYAYRAQVQSGSCGTAFSATHVITVYPVAAGGSITPSLTTIYLGQSSGVLTLSAYTGNIVMWQKSHNGGVWTDIINTNATYSEIPALAGTWEYRAVVESGVCGQVYSAVAVVNVQSASAGVLAGGNSPICIGASTGIMSLSGYNGTIVRWEKSHDGGPWMPIAHLGNFFFESSSVAGTWQYRVVVMGVVEMFSNPITIIVDPAVNSGTLSGGGIVCLGSITPLMSLNSYTGNIVTWEHRFNGGVWNNLGHTFATYSEMTSSAGVHEYRVLVESGTCGQVYSNIVVVTVDPSLDAGVLANTGANTICEGSLIPQLVLNAYSGNIVKWQKSNDGIVWTDISNTSNTYQEVPISAGSWYYRAEVESGSCGTAMSNIQIIVVTPATDAGMLAGINTEICLGNPTGTMTLSAFEGNIVKWQFRIDGGAWTDIAHTSATYNETPVLEGVYDYRVEVLSGVCASQFSNEVTLVVYPNVVAGAVGNNNTICLGSSTGTLTLTGYTGNVVKWQKSDDGTSWTDIVNTNDIYIEIPTSVGTWYYRAEVESGTCGSAYSNYAVITVEDVTVAGVLVAPTTEICIGDDTGVMSLSSYVGNVVKWQSRHNGGLWSDIAVTTDLYTHTPVLSGLWEFRVVVQNGVCDEEMSNIVSVIVHDSPVAGTLTAVNTQICENSSTGLMTVSAFAGTIVKWQKRFNGGAWTDIAHVAPTYEEVIATPGTWDFRVEIESGSCGSTSTNLVTIQVGSSTVPGIIDGNLTEICLGESTDIMVVTGFTGTVQMWQKRLNGGFWIDIPQGSPTYSEVPNQAGIWEYRALVQSGTCASGYTGVYQITVYDIPVADFTYVVNEFVVSFINTSDNATSYLWNFGDGITSTQKHPIHTYATSGSYTVTLTAYNDICEDTYQLTIPITVSVVELDINSHINIFPNPSDDGIFNISFMVDGSYTEFDIAVFDVTGRIIHAESLREVFAGQKHTIHLKDAAAGVYKIRFISSEGQFEKLLIIQ